MAKPILPPEKMTEEELRNTDPAIYTPKPDEWPNVKAPPEYANPHPKWEDPRVPDFQTIWKAARSVGYAVGIHGSLRRDVDLIAVPWTEDAAEPETLIEVLCKVLNARQLNELGPKPHGRRACTLVIDGWYKPIDLSITPTFLNQP